MTPSAEILCSLKVQQQLCRRPAVLCRDATQCLQCVAPSVAPPHPLVGCRALHQRKSMQTTHFLSATSRVFLSPNIACTSSPHPPPRPPCFLRRLSSPLAFPSPFASCRRTTTKAVSGLEMSYYKILIWGANCEN